MKNVIIIGAGAAGMMAAIAAAQNGAQVSLLEKNEKCGKKLFITGKGRCNLTNACDTEELFDKVCTNPKFLYSAFYTYTNQDVIQFFEANGMPTKVERGNRVFPVSDHSSDVIAVLMRKMKQLGVKIFYHTEVTGILTEQDQITGVHLKNGSTMSTSCVIVATGGLSYPSTGSTGEGYRFAKACDLAVTNCTPSLVPMNCKEEYVKEMQGLSLKNVTVTILNGKKRLYCEQGEMMFTHFGVTGPLILTASSQIQGKKTVFPLQMQIDLKPALSEEQLDHRLLREIEENQKKQFKNSLSALLPSKLIPTMIHCSGIDENKRMLELTREERQTLLHLMKAFPITITGLRGFSEAIITKGGVSVKEINPSTMESKQKKGLYFAGEILDLDAQTGGYNLQIAWSTGWLAGLNAAQ